MTSERAIARLVVNSLDEVALAVVYRNSITEIDRVVREWFGSGTVASDALVRVLVGIARSAPLFRPQIQTAESFIVACANSECSRLYSDVGRRVARAQSS